MGRAIDYCTICGDMVPEKDLEKQKAIEVAEKVYCAKCRAHAPAVAAAPGNGRKRTGSTGTFPAIRPVGAPHPGTGRLPNVGSGPQRPAGPATTRLSHLDVDEISGEAKSKTPLIAGAVAGIVLIAAIALFAMQSAADNKVKAAEQKRKDDAKAAFEQVVNYSREQPDDAEGLLKLIETAAPKCKNSEYSGKLAAYRDDAIKLKERLEIRAKRSERLESLRKMLGAKDLTQVITSIDEFTKEMETAGDTELASQSKSLAKTAREKRVLNAIDEAKNFEVQNPDKHVEAIQRWTEVQLMCEGYDSYGKQAADKVKELKERREGAARVAWEQVKTRIDGLRKQKKYPECQKEIQTFTDQWKGSVAVEDATKLAWDIDAESKKAPGPGPEIKTDPGKVPPKEWTTLFDDKTPGQWQFGGKMKWEKKGTAMVGANNLTPEEAKADTVNKGIGFWYTSKPYSGFEVEVDLTLVKGDAIFLVGINGQAEQPAAVAIRTATVGTNAQLIVEHNKAYKVTVQVKGDTISMNATGLQGGNWKFSRAGDGKDHGTGQFGFALNPQSEIQVRSVRIRAIP
ncbi:MAG: hypothetical protein FD180_1658 [Planctomycetota bacterium]|nr:MAG: hypothetical protein FD180_1658 [Planctomycetota bacterium]